MESAPRPAEVLRDFFFIFIGAILEVNDEFLDDATGVTAFIIGVGFVFWKPAVLGALALAGLGLLLYISIKEKR